MGRNQFGQSLGTSEGPQKVKVDNDFLPIGKLVSLGHEKYEKMV